MNNVLKTIIITLLVVMVGFTFGGCNKGKATWLQDGETLHIVDNTLGEGEKNNTTWPHTYKNSTVNESKGYVYVLPVSETNPTVRYFASIKQGTSSNNSLFVDITNMQSGVTINSATLKESITDMWGRGMLFADGTNTASTSVHYTTAITNTKYCYYITNNKTLTVWGDKYVDVTITSPVISGSPLSFTIYIENFHKLPLLLGHKGDTWEIINS